MKSVNKIWPRFSNSTTKTDSPQALKASFFSNEREKNTRERSFKVVTVELLPKKPKVIERHFEHPNQLQRCFLT